MKTKIWVEVDGRFAIGEGGLDLLAAISRRRSLSAAAADVGWSYRHAWGYLRRAEHALGVVIARAVPGKGRRRGMMLTDTGEMILAELRARCEAVRRTAEEVDWPARAATSTRR